MTGEIILCADDYGQSLEISQGILLLAEKKRINAISCMTNTPFWPELQAGLKAVQLTSYIGLHFSLTWGQAKSRQWQDNYGLSFGNLGSLLKKCYSGQLEEKIITAEIHAQVDAFTQASGYFPDFIDGHQHVHQLPIIRDALIAWYKKANITAFIRNTSNGWQDLLTLKGLPKQQIIAILGGIAFNRYLKKHQIPSNNSFAGIYNFKKARYYRNYFQLFLKTIAQGGLIMCHPGMPSNDTTDPLYQRRPHELNYLLGDFFPQDLEDYNLRLAKKPDVRQA